jgi:SNF2 family DNA or RNA helicase
MRDVGAERQLERQLLAQLGLKLDRPTRFANEDAVRFVQRLSAWPGETRGQAHQSYRLTPPLQPSVQLDAGRFLIQFDCTSDAGKARRRIDPQRVLQAWRDGASMLALPGTGWSPLPIDWLERFGHQVADLLAAREAAGTLPTCVLPDLARLCTDMGQPSPPEFTGLQAVIDHFDGIPSAPLPQNLQATLRTYQQRGVDWLSFLRAAKLGALLADDMGLGKTLQALCVLHGSSLVVAPTSVLHNWAHEIERFRPDLHYAIYHGTQRQLDPAADITLTTYAILRLDADVLADQGWETVVLDEAQTIKNPDSQVARAAYRLQAPFRLALSGTPVENRLDDLWSQMNFLNRGLLGGREHFLEQYARPIAAGKSQAAMRLQERIRPFVLRRRKQDVATELPPRTDAVLHCVLSDTERQVYDTIRAATREQVIARLKTGGSVLEALEALLRLRQACCHSDLVPGQLASSSTKIDVLLDALDQIVAEGHKALVFSQWTALLDRVEPHLRQAGLSFVRLDGSTRNRSAVVNHFQDPQGPPLMLISLRAGGLGLNLTAADHVFLLDPWWNPAVEDQAADRTHRIGQERPVMVYRLVAEGTVEEGILALQEHKRSLANAALGGAAQAAGLTRDDLLALLA